MTCKAIVHISGTSGINGTIRLTQTTEDGPTTISGEIRGLGPGKHGIAICTYGDITPGGADLGAMFNPFGMLWSEHFW